MVRCIEFPQPPAPIMDYLHKGSGLSILKGDICLMRGRHRIPTCDGLNLDGLIGQETHPVHIRRLIDNCICCMFTD